MKIVYWTFILSLILLSCGEGHKADIKDYGIIPMPNEIVSEQGSYILQGEKTVAVSSDESSMKVFQYLENVLKNTSVRLEQIAQPNRLISVCL